MSGDNEVPVNRSRDVDRKHESEETKRPCYSCRQLIDLNAKVCHHCGQHQGRIMAFIYIIPT